jgi:hypothetical protein
MSYMPELKKSIEQLLGLNLPQVSHENVGSGALANLKTVEIMQKVAHERKSHPLVRQLALLILKEANVMSQNYVDEALAIGRFVQSRVRYVRDIDGIEQLHDPVTMIDQIKKGNSQGDCDDMSLLIATLLLSIGHQPYYTIVKYNPGPWAHIYVVVYEKNWGKEKQRIVLDGILKRHPIGTEVTYAEKKEIKV